MSLLVSWLTTARSTFSRSSSFSATSTVTISFHVGSRVRGTARVAARLGSRAAASRIVFAATNADGSLPFSSLNPSASATKTWHRTVLPPSFESPARPPFGRASVSSIVTCSDTCAGDPPSGASSATFSDTASPRWSRSTVVPKKSTNPSPISTSSFRADDSDELAANSWQCSAGGPELPSSAFRSAPSLPPSWSLFASGPAESRGTARTKARFVNSGDAVVSVVSVRPVCPALLRSAPTTSRTSSPAKRTFGGLSRLLSVCGRREGEEGGSDAGQMDCRESRLRGS